MNVYFLTNEYPPNVYGGAGVHVEYLSRELSKLTKLYVKCFGNQKVELENLKVQGIDIDKNILNGIPHDLSFVFGAFYKCLKFFNPPFDASIVHCHTWYSHFAGIIAKLAYGIPLVLTTHSLEPLRPWKREQIGKGFDVSSWVENQALTLADAIIAVSNDTKKDILNNFNIDEKKIYTIPNGIDISEFSPKYNIDTLKKYNVDPSKPYLLFLGRITRQKGIIYLVDAIPHINKDIQIVLCAGAPDTEEIKNEMEIHINEVRKTRDNVIWIDEMVSNEEKINLYSNASLFCCPSIYEPFGIINLEAMACETPVVATETGGIPEVVDNGVTGKLVPIDHDINNGNAPKNSEVFSKNLANAINALFNDPKTLKEMSIKSRERAINKFSWESIAKRVYDLYEKILSDSN